MSTETGHQEFTLRYDEDVVRDAIRTFVWRRTVTEQKMMWVIAALMLVFSAYLLVGGETGVFAGIMLVLAFAPLAFVFVLWRVHHVNTYQRFRRMGDKSARISIDAQGFEITSDLGRGRVEWTSITEVWERPRAFMLFSGQGAFNIFPRDGMPKAIADNFKARAAMPPVEQP